MRANFIVVKGTIYQLVDNFTLFYFRFMEQKQDSNFWIRTIGKTAYNVWCRLAFERVCFQHVEQIKKALGISGVISNVYSWVYLILVFLNAKKNQSSVGICKRRIRLPKACRYAALCKFCLQTVAFLEGFDI